MQLALWNWKKYSLFRVSEILWVGCSTLSWYPTTNCSSTQIQKTSGDQHKIPPADCNQVSLLLFRFRSNLAESAGPGRCRQGEIPTAGRSVLSETTRGQERTKHAQAEHHGERVSGAGGSCHNFGASWSNHWSHCVLLETRSALRQQVSPRLCGLPQQIHSAHESKHLTLKKPFGQVFGEIAGKQLSCPTKFELVFFNLIPSNCGVFALWTLDWSFENIFGVLFKLCKVSKLVTSNYAGLTLVPGEPVEREDQYEREHLPQAVPVSERGDHPPGEGGKSWTHQLHQTQGSAEHTPRTGRGMRNGSKTRRTGDSFTFQERVGFVHCWGRGSARFKDLRTENMHAEWGAGLVHHQTQGSLNILSEEVCTNSQMDWLEGWSKCMC